VVASFDGGQITSDAGALLLGTVEWRLGIAAREGLPVHLLYRVRPLD